MELEARLRAFAALARCGTFHGAAEELVISQPAVSKLVAQLERELGVALVTRRPRPVRLTEAGRFLAEHLQRAESLIAQGARGAHALTSAGQGELTIGASGTPGVYFVPRVVAAFHLELPGVRIRTELGTSATVVEAVRAHRVEVGVVGGAVAATDLESEAVLEEEIVLIGPPALRGRRLRARELNAFTWISREEGSATTALIESAWSDLGIVPARRLVLPSWEGVKVAVANGAGVAAVGRTALDAELVTRSVAVLDVPHWRVRRHFSLVHAEDVPLTPLAERFSALVRSMAEQVMRPRPRRMTTRVRRAERV